MTVKGEIYYDSSTTGNASSDYLGFTLPGIAPVALAALTVNFAADPLVATTDDDSTCTGAQYLPTAPAGKVCIYVTGVAGMSALSGGAFTNLPTRGFVVRYVPTPTVGLDLVLYATWAYTAP